MRNLRNPDQAIHPAEQDGFISGAYLDREYDAAWFASKNDHAWNEYERAQRLARGEEAS